MCILSRYFTLFAQKLPHLEHLKPSRLFTHQAEKADFVLPMQGCGYRRRQTEAVKCRQGALVIVVHGWLCSHSRTASTGLGPPLWLISSRNSFHPTGRMNLCICLFTTLFICLPLDICICLSDCPCLCTNTTKCNCNE